MVNSKNEEMYLADGQAEQPKGFISKAKNGLGRAAFAGVSLAMPVFAFAADGDDDFNEFKTAIEDLITGSLGKGVALVALLLGGLIGLAKSSAWPALTGLAIAAIFGLGPFLIDTIFTTFGAVGDAG